MNGIWKSAGKGRPTRKRTTCKYWLFFKKLFSSVVRATVMWSYGQRVRIPKPIFSSLQWQVLYSCWQTSNVFGIFKGRIKDQWSTKDQRSNSLTTNDSMFQTKAFAVPHTTRLMRIMKKERRRPNLRRDLVALLQQLVRKSWFHNYCDFTVINRQAERQGLFVSSQSPLN